MSRRANPPSLNVNTLHGAGTIIKIFSDKIGLMPSPKEKIGPIQYIVIQAIWFLIVCAVVTYVNLRHFRGFLFAAMPAWAIGLFWLIVVTVTFISGHISITGTSRDFYTYLYSVGDIVRLFVKLFIIAIILVILYLGFKHSFFS